MDQPGRKSLVALATAGGVSVQERPRPPNDLTPAQAAVWMRVVNSREAGWFSPDTHGLLISYCRAHVSADQIAAELNAFDPEWLKTADGLARWTTLHKLADAKASSIVTLSRQMRLSQQSQYHKDAKGNKATAPKRPWES